MPPALLLYTSCSTPRLQYVLQWIVTEQLGIHSELTADPETWKAYNGPKVNYSKTTLADDELRIVPHTLLAEEGVREQELSVQRWKHSTVLFYNQPGAVVPFDLFAAVFYGISRYEEYLPYTADAYGRYPHQESVAARYSFLQQPVADEWLFHFGKILENKFGITLPQRSFRFQPTYDIDIAWKYLYKGSKRHWGGYLKDLFRLNLKAIADRRAVVAGKRNDPYDCFGWLDSLHRQYNLEPVYFLLLGRLSAFDKNADPQLPAMQELMRSLASKYTTGIHPSYGSHNNQAILQEEIALLQRATGTAVSRSRQHYIRFTLPETYERLIEAGITDDYSMGYASVNGFRAGTSQSFPWYNLETEEATTFRTHPFAFMEATSKFYNKQSPDEAWKEWERLWHTVKKVNGTFISICHNHLLGPAPENKGWREWYEKVLAYAKQQA